MGELDFKCDECETLLTIKELGFLGEEQHLNELLNNKTEIETLECHPFVSLITLCNVCLEKRKLTIKKNKKNG